MRHTDGLSWVVTSLFLTGLCFLLGECKDSRRRVRAACVPREFGWRKSWILRLTVNSDEFSLPKLEIRLLGPPQLAYCEGATVRLTSAKAQALLYYLAVTGRTQVRSTLANLLWSEHGEAEARGNLRKVIQQLREQMSDYLVFEGELLGFRSEQVYWVDAVEFAATLSPGQIADSALLETALQLYRGDFLEGFYIRNAPEFEAWMFTERARLRELMLQGLDTLAFRYAAQGNLIQAIATIRRLLDLEPWREESHRQLMEWLAQNGQRSEALVQYELCVRALAGELAVEPSQATRSLYQRLLRSDRPPPATQTPHLPAMEYSLVGRQHEWQTLRSVWHQVLHGGAHCVAIAGEAGIGKTRLAEELLVYAQRQGYPAARARTYALEGRLAYGPVADWLRTEALHPQLARLDKVWLSEVARLLPELWGEHPDLPPPQPLTEPWQRKRLFEALVQIFRAGDRPLLLLLDDLQWCDADTLEWVQYLLSAAPQPQLLLVTTVRTEEVDDDSPLPRVWASLAREGKLTTIHLEPLSAAETATLGAEVSKQILDADTAGQLFRTTAGNPLFIVESVQAGSDRGIGEEGSLGGFLPLHPSTPIPLLPITLPPKVHAVIHSRLAQLSAEAHTVAQLAAVCGRAFTVELLGQAGQQDEEAVVQGLDELWRRRLVRELEPGSYDFSHDLIRDVAYGELSPIRRRQLHRTIAQALESIYAADLEPVSAQVAAHYELGGLPERAVSYFRQAAGTARRI